MNNNNAATFAFLQEFGQTLTYLDIHPALLETHRKISHVARVHTTMPCSPLTWHCTATDCCARRTHELRVAARVLSCPCPAVSYRQKVSNAEYLSMTLVNADHGKQNFSACSTASIGGVTFEADLQHQFGLPGLAQRKLHPQPPLCRN